MRSDEDILDLQKSTLHVLHELKDLKQHLKPCMDGLIKSHIRKAPITHIDSPFSSVTASTTVVPIDPHHSSVSAPIPITNVDSPVQLLSASTSMREKFQHILPMEDVKVPESWEEIKQLREKFTSTVAQFAKTDDIGNIRDPAKIRAAVQKISRNSFEKSCLQKYLRRIKMGN